MRSPWIAHSKNELAIKVARIVNVIINKLFSFLFQFSQLASRIRIILNTLLVNEDCILEL